MVAKKTGFKDADALTAFLKDMPTGNPEAPAAANPELQKVADLWNTGFDTKTLPATRPLTCPTVRSWSRASTRTSP